MYVNQMLFNKESYQMEEIFSLEKKVGVLCKRKCNIIKKFKFLWIVIEKNY